MKKKIGIFLGCDPSWGGTFQYNQSFLAAVSNLPEDEFSVVVAFRREAWAGYLKELPCGKLFIPKGLVSKVCLGAWNRTGLPVSWWRRLSPLIDPTARALLAQQCDLWIFPSQDSVGYQVPVPALVAIHDLMHRYERRFPEVSAKGEYRHRERLYRSICRWAKGVLVDSEVGKTQVMESYGMDASRIHVLPFIAPNYIHGSHKCEDFEARYALPPKYVFYPAQFWKHKNHVKLVEAAYLLKDKIKDFKLVFTGSPQNAFKEVAKKVKELALEDKVVFLGYVPDEDMAEIYRRARAMVMPTFFGPTNIPPLEAFVAGCPVAISDIYGIPDQVGEAALLFDPNSAEEIAGCTERLWLDDRLCAELVERGKERIEGWTQRHFNQKFEMVLEQVFSR